MRSKHRLSDADPDVEVLTVFLAIWTAHKDNRWDSQVFFYFAFSSFTRPKLVLRASFPPLFTYFFKYPTIAFCSFYFFIPEDKNLEFHSRRSGVYPEPRNYLVSDLQKELWDSSGRLLLFMNRR